MIFIWLRRIIGFFLFIISLCLAAGCFYYYHVKSTLPDVKQLKEVTYETPLQIYSADNLLIGEYGTDRRIPLEFEQIPQQVKDAFIAIEDRSFYSHFGIDLKGILRAAKVFFEKGKMAQGASTITQQVARNFYLSPEKNITRKLKEIFISIHMEQELTKDEILTLYLNKISFSHHANGIAAAAYIYFGKTVDELTLGETAILAGMPKAPSTNNPISNPDKARERRHLVLLSMLSTGKITQEQFDEADNEPINSYYHVPKIEANAGYVAESIRQTLEATYGDAIYTEGFKVYSTVDSRVQEKANQAVYNGLTDYDMRHGFRAPENLNDLGISSSDHERWQTELKKRQQYDYITPALVVSLKADNSANIIFADDSKASIPWNNIKWASNYNNQNKNARHPVERILKPGDIIYVHKTPAGEYALRQVPLVQGALISVNAQTGAILSMVGGYSYRKSSFNRVELSKRQAGSNIKPFLYSAALAKGYSLGTYVLDEKFSIWNKWSNQIWSPKNSPNVYEGPIPLRVALAKSKNVVSVRLLNHIGVGNFVKHLKKFGIDVNQKYSQNLSLALGAYEVTPLELVTAYCTFANGGYKIEPYLIDKIVIGDTEQVIYEANPAIACTDCPDAVTNTIVPEVIDEEAQYLEDNNYAEQVITHGNAFLISDALGSVIHGGYGPKGPFNGTGTRARAMKRSDIAGKTGTTNDSKDAWFSGFNANIATTVWVGHDSFSKALGRGESGSKTALPIWIEFMSYILKDQPLAPVSKPDYIVKNSIYGYPEFMISNGKDLNFGYTSSSDEPQTYTQQDEYGAEIHAEPPQVKPESSQSSAIEDLF